MSDHLHVPEVPVLLSILSGGVNPFAEVRARLAGQRERQTAEANITLIVVQVSITAIDNNWSRVVARLEREIDTPYPNQTFYLDEIYAPNPACDNWTIFLAFNSLADYQQNAERLRDKIERICNDHRR